MSPATPAVRCGVMITTRNRLDDLRRTCAQLARLDPPPDDVLICLDGCTDATESFLQTEYPHFRRLVHPEGRGSIGSRDEMMRALESPEIVFSLDDDSYPLELDAIARLRALFTADPQLALAAFPQRTDEFPESMTATDFGPPRPLASYASSAAALRRAAFLQLGGYPAQFFHMYEEPDYALRCCAAGYTVRFSPEITVRHHYSGAGRNELRIHHLHARNELWSVLLRCPYPQLPAVLFFRAFRQFTYACQRGWRWVVREPQWWLATLRGLATCRAQRHPLPWTQYFAWMKLLRRS